MRLNIGPLTIELSGVTEQEIPVNSRLFLDRKPADKRADRHYTFHFVGRLPLPSNDWQAIFRRNDIVIFRKEERETRLLAIGNLNACYALYQEKDERNADIYFIEGLKRELQTDTLFISCLCLERPLSARGCYILCQPKLCWQCPMMSFIATILFNGGFNSQIFATFCELVVRNFPMAFFWQLFVAGPLVRFIFGKIFREN